MKPRRKSRSSSRRGGRRHQNSAADGVPPFMDDNAEQRPGGRQAMDSQQSSVDLETTSRLLKGNLNASFVEEIDGINGKRSGGGGSDENLAASMNSFGSMGSGANDSRSSRGGHSHGSRSRGNESRASYGSRSHGSRSHGGRSLGGRSHGRRSRGGGRRTTIEADHFDVPHLDDMMRASQSSSPADAAAGSRGKRSAIIVEDEEAHRKRGGSPYRDSDAGGRDLDMPTLSAANKDRRSSWLFEKVWGSYNDDTTSDCSGFDSRASGSRPVTFMRTVSGRVGFMRNSAYSPAPGWEENYPSGYYGRGGRCVRFIRGQLRWTILCVVMAVVVAATVGALVVMIPIWMQGEEMKESGELGGLTYDGGKAEGRGSSADGRTELDHSGETSPVDMSGDGMSNTDTPHTGAPHTDAPPTIPAADAVSNNDMPAGNGGAVQNEASPVAGSGSAGNGSKKIDLKPPPYNLQFLCSRPSLSDPSGYQKCLSACLPSRCCLVPENKPYEVWTLQVGDRPGTPATNLKARADEVAIGDVLPSCRKEHPDQCVKYNNQCLQLGKGASGASVLLPRKPPSLQEVAAMDGKEKFELAEWVNHACMRHKTRAVGMVDKEECRSLCVEKACCFAGEEGEKEKEENDDDANQAWGEDKDWVHQPIADTVQGSIANELMETAVRWDDDDGLGPNANMYDDGLGFNMNMYDDLLVGHEPTSQPTMVDLFTYSPTKAGTYLPTPGGSSYRPTREDEVITRRLGERMHLEEMEAMHTHSGKRKRQRQHGNSPQLGHMTIPGEEDFVYILEGQGQDNGAFGYQQDDPSGPVGDGGEVDLGSTEPGGAGPDGAPGRGDGGAAASCVNDPRRFCMTYAGCAPLFGG